MIEKGEASGVYKINNKMYSLGRLVRVSCKDQSLNQSKPLFSLIFGGIMRIAS
jgi:hypothetical protein